MTTTPEAGAVWPDPALLPAGARTRFAPAPTGFLHLGHLVNAIYVWGVARAVGGRVVLRIEDHDRQRSRSTFDRAIVEDLGRLGLVADEGPVRQTAASALAAYEAAYERLRAGGLVYACDCARSTFARWAAGRAGRPWAGPGCPGGCRSRELADGEGRSLRVELGDGEEGWVDLLLLGERSGSVAVAGDLPVRDRAGNWTYTFCVVVDDLRQGIDLVIRGADLTDATAAQIRLARLLGRERPPAFLHHPLIRKPGGAKLSKADRDTSVRELLDSGASPAVLFGRAAAAVGLVIDGVGVGPDELGALFAS